MPQFMLRQFTLAIASILDGLLSLYWWIVLIAVVLTWVNPDPRNPIVRFFHSVTEPVLYQIRRRLPFIYAAGVDFSPAVLLAVIYLARMVVVQSLYELAVRIAEAHGAFGSG
jgi:YggT family protein